MDAKKLYEDSKIITATDGVFDSLSAEDKVEIQNFVAWMLDNFNGGDWQTAKDIWETAVALWMTQDQQVAAWGFLDSKMRAYLKGDRYNEQDAGWVDKK